MRPRHRRFLAATAAVTLASGLAVVEAPAVFAASGAVTAERGTQVQPSPVTVALGGLPGTVKAGGSPVEFTATLRNTADHQVDVVSSAFVIGDTGTGTRQSQFKLEYQSPGGAQWQDAKVNAATVGAFWEIDRSATLRLAAGAEAVYRLRLTVTADAPAGRVTPGFDANVEDPTLPREQRSSLAQSGWPGLVITPAVTPTTQAPTPAATADVKLEGVPATFTAGGEVKPFKLVFTNNSGRDLRVMPTIVFQGETELPFETVRFEYQGPDGAWLPGGPGGNSEHPAWLYMDLRPSGVGSDVFALPNGGTHTINARLAFTKDAAARTESLVALAGSLPGAGESGARSSSQKADFTIVAAAGPSVTPTPDPTSSAAPAPTAAQPSSAPVVPVIPVAQATGASPSPAAVGSQVVAAAAPDARLASTGGGSSAAPMAITGVTAIALGVGILVVAWRRNRVRAGAGN
ncbi:hypothetical protein ACFU7Y_43420 [Kitasatospora sp. NPDC057542]|uniref:hypothetical protein n=1 Tax=Kitasatospora sp. NPDC057542 TaxID=3346162 RepID=UPI0036C42D1D